MFAFLSALVPIHVSFFRIPRFSGIIVGIWPQSNGGCTFFTILRFLFNTFVVAVGAFGECSYGFVYISNLVGALEAWCPGVTKAICLLKMVLFFINSKDWFRIVERMRALIFSDTSDPKKMQIIEGLASTANILSFILLFSGSITNAFFNTRPLVAIAIKHASGEEVVWNLPFNIILPDVFRNYPLYPLTYCILTLSGAMTVFTFSFVDGFFLCSCAYMCGLFRMLQYDIRQTFATLQACDFATSQQNFQIRRNLAALVERHNLIIDLCSDLTSKFTLIILMHFLSAALVVCFSILDLLLNSGSMTGVILYVCYSIAALTQLLLYCIGGNYVSESSSEVADTLYCAEWYKCDVKTRKMILMMLRRAQKSKTIAVPFFAPSLPAFASIISTAGSYVTLLKTFL